MPVNRFVSFATVAVLAAGGLTACTEDATATCPSGAPSTANAPDWTYQGRTGSIVVTGPTDSSAPLIKVEQPFAVDETHVQRFNPEGDGAVVAEDNTVTVCYLGVNGRTGERFDSSFDRGKPASFAANGVIAGFQKALVGQKVGSSVGVAIAPQDGYTTGNPDAGIQPGDTLIFSIKILAAK